MGRNEYRQLPRISTNMPLKVDIPSHGKSRRRTEVCTSDNIAAGGIHFFCYEPIEVGTLVSMVLVMPREVSHWAPLPYEFMGKVLRVDPVGASEVNVGIAAKFLALRHVLPATYVSEVAGGRADLSFNAVQVKQFDSTRSQDFRLEVMLDFRGIVQNH